MATKSKSLKTVFTIFISIILAVLLIWWAMQGLDLDKTIESIKDANYIWVGISFLMGILAYWLRSQRWRLLLEPMGYSTKASHSFYSICMNYFWNLVIPRSGELARSTTLYALDKTAVDKSFGSVITERVIDFICLLIIATLALIFNYDLIPKLIDEVLLARSEESENGINLILWGTIVLFSVLLLIFIFRKKIKKLPIYPKIQNFLHGLRQGLKSIFELKERKLFILYTFLIWFFYYLMTYMIVFSLPETSHLSPAIGLYLLLVGGIGMVIPASGGIGAYHAAMRLGFVALGLGSEIGLTFAFLVHTPHTLIALLLGLISIVLMAIEKRRNLSS